MGGALELDDVDEVVVILTVELEDAAKPVPGNMIGLFGADEDGMSRVFEG